MTTDMQQDNRQPKRRAVAIKYTKTDIAPRVTAKGSGYVADRIAEKAKAADVPIHKDAALVNELTRLDLGESIPPELYEVVAQILLFISDLDKLEKWRK